MSNEVQMFSNGNINLPVKQLPNGDILFDAEQSAIGLGISHTANSGNIVVRWERVNKYLGVPTSGHGKIGRGDYITEPQFYKLAIKANNEVAERFQNWVTSEVLPAIRKHGAYMTDEKAFNVVNNADGLADLLKQAADQLKAKDIQIAEMKPKALFADAVSTSETNILIGELAKILKGNGVNIGQNRLFQWMREHGYLIKRKGMDYNMPTQHSMELGLFKIKETAITHSDGHTSVNKTTKVTGKGQQYFVKLFLDNKGA